MGASSVKPHFAIRTLGVFLLLMGCRNHPSEPVSCDFEPASDEQTRRLAERFENDSAFRRVCLEKSLVNRHNGYSTLRLAHYHEKDWGSLPVAAFKTRPIVPADLGKPIPVPDEAWSVMPNDTLADSPEGLHLRGEQMFTRFPAQLELSMIPILRQAGAPAEYGLWQTSASVGGLVWVALPGGIFPALTCSSCHASVKGAAELRPGVPNHRIDIGKARDDYTNLRSLYSTWGPGRVDVAADERDNPVVIADVRAVRYERYLHRTANVRNSLVALALRVETGLITAHSNAVRPTPKDAFALAYYLWNLGKAFEPADRKQHPGRREFEKHCASCHQGPALAGEPVSAESIDSPTARMPSVVRGTGKVQTISLLGVSDRRRLLFGGEATSLEQLLDPNRQVGGHYVGKKLSHGERGAILQYLQRL